VIDRRENDNDCGISFIVGDVMSFEWILENSCSLSIKSFMIYGDLPDVGRERPCCLGSVVLLLISMVRRGDRSRITGWEEGE